MSNQSGIVIITLCILMLLASLGVLSIGVGFTFDVQCEYTVDDDSELGPICRLAGYGEDTTDE